MRIIPTKIHGFLDYLMGILLIAAPWILNFHRGGPETYVPIVLGAGVIFYSLLTNYELGLVKKIPMNLHLGFDLIGGGILAASPWLFGFADYIFLPHLIFGILEIGASLMTGTSPEAEISNPAERAVRYDEKVIK
jgi:hypothetical protein